jgi:hypothetical protein
MKVNVKAERWPWQKREPHWSHCDMQGDKWGWKPIPGMGRFGGGWNYNLGFQIGSKTVILNLIFGQVTIRLRRSRKCSK